MDPRQELVDYLTRQLVGPAGGEGEVLDAPPDRQYLMGTLYPQQADLQRQLARAADDPEAPGVEQASSDTNPAADPVPETNSWLPASLGLSFYTAAAEIEVTCAAARYETQRNDPGRGRRWQRLPLPAETHTVGPDRQAVTVLDGRAELRLRRRPYGDGSLVTVALVNKARHDGSDGKTPSWDDMLFQCRLTVRPVDGTVLPYPSVRLASRDPEERELRLQYRRIVTHAVGHGCAVREEAGDHDDVETLVCEALPQAEVPAVRAGGPLDAPVLTISHLADPAVSGDQLREELAEFAATYHAWYVGQRSVEVPTWGQEAAERVLGRVRQAVIRIEAGVRTLCDPDRPELLDAFRIAQRAMLLQMRHSAPDQAGRRWLRSDSVAADPPVDPTAAWRPFQLAFFLLALDGVADPGHRDREATDLIWFPTGGGKTEAYLLLAAFTVALRRIRGEGGGTTVLSRYTLSLLTTQQFQRAATTVCALEYLRRSAPGLGLGDEPITVGLWVGDTTTPNSFQAAKDAFGQQRDASHPGDVFILDRCPWCGTRIMPPTHSAVRSDYGIKAEADTFAFNCTRDECAFRDVLPVAVVDQHLYEQPPTFVLGTVDKFARLAWEPLSGRLFGAGTGNPPPSLIIQDELHLLTGPLGTTVGLYEAAVLELCTGSDGRPPKIVAATATIRRSAEQVRALHHQDVQLFPPPGLDADDSFFAVPDTGRPGRLYLGVMAQGHTAGRGAVATTAAMLQGVHQLPEEHRDDYWTLVAYHHSLRELGRTVTAAGDDIPAQLRGLDEGMGIRPLGGADVQQLDSTVARADQPILLDRLEKPWTDSQAVSFLPCTNMLSVGVDVKRLAYMLMQGQPKTTAEYIQATSRVGRHHVPGLVVTYFNATRPRDRSHYETFIDYHGALYRYVEPASVTPWSEPARRRALHATLVVLVRHRLGLSAENQAGRITGHRAEADRIADALAGRAAIAESGATGRDGDAVRAEVRADLGYLLDDWCREAARAQAEGKDLYYHSQGKGQYNLLKTFEQRYGLWETLNSMRSVDRECQITVTGAGK
ncbi:MULTISPECIES: helicase-related protein [unclassified Streptomyces]|uniref:helicase-related protein n=1 Tax=unclassified Streptomyces TaxID=2593676 RepID=UPI001E3E5F3D|nr:helicase-related protein [Streptomyces sp. CB02980]MCB8905777.1 helicase [Streptomyces sp. CB02980]